MKDILNFSICSFIKSEYCPNGSWEHALIVMLMGFKHFFHFFFCEFHSLKHDSDQINLHRRVRCHEVRHQDVFEIFRVNAIFPLQCQLLVFLNVFRLKTIVLTFESIELSYGLLELVLQFFLLLPS